MVKGNYTIFVIVNNNNMITTKQRVTFNLKHFVEELEESLITIEKDKEMMDLDYVEDVVGKLKTFLSNSSEEVKKGSMSYLLKHPSVQGSKRIQSFIKPCFT